MAVNGAVMRWINGQEPVYLYPCGDTLNSVAYGDGLPVAVGGNGAIVTGDFKHWTVKRVGGSELRAVAWNDYEYVAVGENGTILSSPDGASWSAVAGAAGLAFNGVAYGNGTWVAVGEGPGGAVVYSSANGWHQVSDVPGGALCGVAYGSDGFTAVGANGTIIYSEDGSAWCLEPELPTTQTLYDIVGDNALSVCGGRPERRDPDRSGADGWSSQVSSGTFWVELRCGDQKS